MNKEKQDQFLMIPYKLLRAVGYVKPDGVCVPLTLTEKMIYAHIQNRFIFFKKRGNEYYDTQQDMANKFNMDVKSVGKIIRKFMEQGLISFYKKRFNGFPKNVYTDVPNLVLYYKDKNTESNDEPEISKEDFEGEHWRDDFDYGDVPDWAK